MNVFGRREKLARVDMRTVEDVIWLCDNKDSKRHPGQLMDREFYQYWLDSMYRAFHLLGMPDRYQQFQAEERKGSKVTPELKGFVPVKGWKNRHSLRKATENVQEACPTFHLVPVQYGKALMFTGKRREALHEWHEIMELLMKTTVAAIVTDALSHYVVGTQVGYSPEIKHLFRKGNTVQRLGTPFEPMWELNISDYTVVLDCPWDKAADTQRELGFSLLQQMQLALNDALEQTLRREREG